MFAKPRSMERGAYLEGDRGWLCLFGHMKPLNVGWDICMVTPTRQVESWDVFSERKSRLEMWTGNQGCPDHEWNHLAYSATLEERHC